MWSVIFLVVFSLFSPNFFCVFFSMLLGVLLFFLKYNFYAFSGVIFVSRVFYLDALSYYFIFLTFILFVFVILLEFYNFFSSFVFFLQSLLICLLFFFLSKHVFYFFVFFEASFIFIFLMILFWGHNPERIEALNYFIIYSLAGSVPLLIFIIFFQYCCMYYCFFWDFSHLLIAYNLEDFVDEGVNNFYIFYAHHFYCFFWILVFLIKFPMFGLHLWLPKAHVESPVYGSMLLAGILIKLGVVGIFRFIYSIRNFFFNEVIVNNLFYYTCLGLILVNFICSRQWDLKSFVAYSSVVHMSLVIFSIWTGTYLSVLGCILLSFSHGLCSSALFLNVNGFYLLSGSRSLYLNRGYIYLHSCLCLLWFLLCASNCSFPLGLGFFSEIFLILSGVYSNFGSIFSFFFNIFFCGLYCMFLYLYVVHGKSNLGLNFSGRLFFDYVYLLLLFYHFFILYFYFSVLNTIMLVV
uniref:NADH dehydrogenase subunit 4 n=1 Tax=Arthurdendyus triangulatus TaxID=132421 RepID=UPI002E79A086|nr:NADH dehydrogenase subunit 4 [Arthurdendyus triangulatus]WPY71423.1 NADH dehydrogenase subunit 4 [Arthurdendyus triangulatus]